MRFKVPGLIKSRKPKGRSSLQFRQDEQLLREGKATAKYTRILPFVPGETVFEMGAAEGVLSLLLSEKKKRVWAVEKSMERHQRAKELKDQWIARGFQVDSCEMVHGDIQDHSDLLDASETFLSVRALYYLGPNIEDVLAGAWSNVENVVLVGNRFRSEKYFSTRSNSHKDGEVEGADNYYASLDGMWTLVSRLGFSVRFAIPDGDPILVASRNSQG